MKMKLLRYEGQTQKVTELEFLAWLEALADGECLLAESFYGGHLGGLPDIEQKLWVSLVGETSEYIHKLIQQIDDDELREMFLNLEHLSRQRAVELDNQLVAEIAQFLNLPDYKTLKDRRKILREMDNYTTTGKGRIWIHQPGYQQIARQSEQNLAAVIELKEKIDERIANLREEISGPPTTAPCA